MKIYRLKETTHFTKWMDKLDAQTRRRIYARLDKACATGHFGDHHGVGGGVSEMRFDFAHGLRVYYAIMRDEVILLTLTGGDKSGQQRDIERARALLPDAMAKVRKELEEEKKRGKTT